MKLLDILFGSLAGYVVAQLASDGVIGKPLAYWLFAIGLLFLFCKWIAGLLISDAGFAGFMESGGLGRIYGETLKAVLDRLDRWLCPPEYLDGTDPSFVQPPRWQRAWNWRAYDRMLLLAVVYPLGLPLLIWMLTGRPAQLGNLEIIPAPEAWWQLPLAWAAILALIFSRRLARRLHALAVQPMLNAVSRVVLARPAYPELGLAFVQMALLFAATSALVLASVFPGPLAFVFVTALAFAIARADAGASAIVISIALGFAIGFALVEVFAIAAMIAFAVAIAVEYLATRRRRPAATYAVFTTLALAVVFSAPSRLSEDSPAVAPTLLLFLGQFPLVNAVWDFASVGLTRFCLRQSALPLRWHGLPAELRPPLFAILDLLGALATLAALILCLLLGVSAINALAPHPVLPLTRLIADLRPGSGGPDITWAYLMVFSTLLPTLVHLVLFILSLVLRYPGRRICRRLAAMPADGPARAAYGDRVQVVAALWVTVPVALAALAAWYLLPQAGSWHDAALDRIIDMVQWIVVTFHLA